MILYLDDEIYARPYIKRLESAGFEVDHVKKVNQALKNIVKDSNKYQFLILDGMIPANSKDVKLLKKYNIMDGLRTGTAFMQYLIDHGIGENIIIIILTNIVDTSFHSLYQKHNRVTECLKKEETTPDRLVEIINNKKNRERA